MFVETKREGEVTAPIVLEPWRQALLDAADYIDKHGHCKRRMTNERGEVCAAGAIYEVTHRRVDYYSPAIFALEKAVGGHIVPWNDAPWRTATEVTAKMREVARS